MFSPIGHGQAQKTAERVGSVSLFVSPDARSSPMPFGEVRVHEIVKFGHRLIEVRLPLIRSQQSSASSRHQLFRILPCPNLKLTPSDDDFWAFTLSSNGSKSGPCCGGNISSPDLYRVKVVSGRAGKLGLAGAICYQIA